MDEKHHYASLAFLAAMMITVTTHCFACQAGSIGTLEMYIEKIERLEKTNHDDAREGG